MEDSSSSERPPTPPCPPTVAPSSETFSRSGNFVTRRRPTRFFSPLSTYSNMATSSPRSYHPQTPSIVVSSATPSKSARKRPADLFSIVTSPSTSPSSSRSSSPSDHRSRSPMILTGKAPATTPATPVFTVARRRQSFNKEKIVVGVRVRPFIAEDRRHHVDESQVAVSRIDEGSAAQIQVNTKSGSSLVFEFDHAFGTFDENAPVDLTLGQVAVYTAMVKPLVDSMIAGYNCSFFAYGQTGTGKTFSTLGTKDHPGMVPRFCRDILCRLQDTSGESTWKLEVSYYEIYNENIIDLFATAGQRVKLRIREHPDDGPFVENLISVPVRNYDDIAKCLDEGNSARSKVSTTRNDNSSRSHAIFQLQLVQMKNVDGLPVMRKSKASFIDLAGSERLDPTSSSMSNANRMAETKNINKSLTHLAKVILQLSNGQKSRHISYRDSALTLLLKDSLGGNAKTVMLATIAPALAYIDETISTLRYASNAYKVYNQTCVNEDPAIRIIEQLKMENERMKAALANGGTISHGGCEQYAMELQTKVEQLEKALQGKESQLAWEREKVQLAERELLQEKEQTQFFKVHYENAIQLASDEKKQIIDKCSEKLAQERQRTVVLLNEIKQEYKNNIRLLRNELPKFYNGDSSDDGIGQ